MQQVRPKKCQLILSSSSSAIPVQFQPFMAKCRALQIYPATRLSYPSLASNSLYIKSSQIKFKKISMASMTMFDSSITGQGFQIFRRLQDCSKSALQPCIRPGSITHATSRFSLGFGFYDVCIGLASPNYVSFAKRCLSQVSVVAYKNSCWSARDKTIGNRFGIRGFHTQQKQSKALAVQPKNRASNSTVSTCKDANTKSSEQLIGDGKNGTKRGSTGSRKKESEVNGKQKQPSRKKKTKEQPPSTVASEEISIQKGSKTTPRRKSSTTNKTTCSSSQDLENNSPINVSPEVHDSPASTKNKSNKKSVSSPKGKSVKAAKDASQKQVAEDMSIIRQCSGTMPKQLYPPTGKSVVVVESATKAKVIQGYLGEMYEVLASYGHVRDLAARSGSVRPDDDFSMVWDVPSPAWTHLKSIKVALSGAENLILASDPDREGEAIAWHILEMLHQQDALHEKTNVARVVFNEITESSIKNALQSPREIDADLVRAYLARRALDYLIGFNISPLLWRKLPGCQSAGRVQSAALSLICDREIEIDEFKPQEYWTVAVELKNIELGLCFQANLTHFSSKKLNQFSISSITEANDIEQKINSEQFHVMAIKRNTVRRNPPTPYITSTLQQDAANKLQFSTMNTMRVAQKLYEGVQLSDGKATGLITYMRTDGLHISSDAVEDIRSMIVERYGSTFKSESPRKYFKKVKNAQEAHEAIRPTNIWRLPSMLVGILEEDCLKLYTLIWSRTVACQMEPLRVEQIQLDVENAGKSIVLRSSCSRIEFLGYQAVYEDIEAGAIKSKDSDGTDRIEAFGVLNSLKSKDPLCLGKVELKQHHTQPPPRFSEGSLVKKLEELGIGRPSTYATTIKVLQDRKYVTLKNRAMWPEFRGRMVSAFLAQHFTEVTNYSFTADMETELDNVSAGATEWKGLLRDFWTRFKSYYSVAEGVHIHKVEKMLEERFEGFLFGSLPEQSRNCPSCTEGTLTFKLSRFGAGYFIGCDQHPRCKYIARTIDCNHKDDTDPRPNLEEPKLLGLNPGSSEKILLKNGPYGTYVQLGEDRKGYPPKRAPVPSTIDVDSISAEDALELLRYPVTLGDHPEDEKPVVLKLSKFGFSVRHGRTTATVPKDMKQGEVTLKSALKLLSGKNVTQSGRRKKKKEYVEEEEEEAIEAL